MGKPFARRLPQAAKIATCGLIVSCLAIGEAVAQAPDGIRPTRPRVAEVALADALRRLAAQLPLEVRLDPIAAQIPVKVDLSGVAPYIALDRMLSEAGVDFAIGPLGDRILVVVGSRARAMPLAPEDPPAQASPSLSAPDGRGGKVAAGDEVAEDAAAPEQWAERVLAPGEMSTEELLEVFAVPTSFDRRAAGWVELPFPGDDGRPLRIWRGGDAQGRSGPPAGEVPPARPSDTAEVQLRDEPGRLNPGPAPSPGSPPEPPPPRAH